MTMSVNIDKPRKFLFNCHTLTCCEIPILFALILLFPSSVVVWRQNETTDTTFAIRHSSFASLTFFLQKFSNKLLLRLLPMLVPHPRNSRVFIAPLFFCMFHTFFTGSVLCAQVSLSSIEIFKTHEWLKVTPTVYFLCKGENKTVFPDVKKAHVFYDFNGQESWQPLTNFSSKKCKRCGFYEEDSIKSDDVFDEWEFCPSDFTTSNGEYIRFKGKEFNATFLCPECLSIPGVDSLSGEHGKKAMHVAVIVLLSGLVLAILAVGVVVAYKFWQKKRREQDQARFLKLFEDGDDIEDELGLGTVI